jgi:threonine dehydrogenase-like Zn-dependent dehydrogenase
VVLIGLAGNDVTARFRIDDAINNDPLITHRFPLEAYAEAYQVLRDSDGPRGKVMLDIDAP